MSALKVQWQAGAARFAAMSRREQMLIAVAALAICFFLPLTLWVDPASKRAAALRTQLATQQTELITLQAQIASLQAGLADPDAANRQKLAELQAKMNEVDNELGTLDDKLVSPEQMGKVLQAVLSHHRGLALVSLRSLTPEALLAPPEEKAGAQKSAVAVRRENIWRHGLEIRVSGRYADLLAYVAELERSPQRLLWDGLAFKVTEWPRNELTLTVYTLSRERDWLAV